MILFGYSDPPKQLDQSFAQKPLGMASCPNCREEGYLWAFAYARYFHIDSMPIVSIGKTVRANCMNCGTEFKGKKLPKSALVYAKELKRKVKIPFWHSAGLSIVIGSILLFVIVDPYIKKLDAKNIQNPKVNDVYHMDLTEGFSAWKIIDIKDDTLIFHTYGIYFDSSVDLYEIDVYTGDTIKYHHEKIKEMFLGEDITSIRRK